MARIYFYIALFFSQWSEMKSVYNCTYYTKLFLKPNRTGCQNYMCWESQLTDRNRNELTKIFNEYRSSVSEGTCASCRGQCYGVIFKLNYHWVPEYTCILWLQNMACTLPPDTSTIPALPYNKIESESLYSGVLSYYINRKFILKNYGSINTFKLEYDDFRNDVIEKIKNVLQDENDSKRFLKSWENEDRYIYGRYSYYGCAILVINNMTGKTDFGGTVSNGRVAFVACMFIPLEFKADNKIPLAAKPVDSFNSIRDCPPNTKDVQSVMYKIADEEMKLCDVDFLPEKKIEAEYLRLYDVPCQIYYHTSKIRHGEICNDKVTPEWAYNVYPDDEDEEIDLRYLEDPNADKVRLDKLNTPTTTNKFAAIKLAKSQAVQEEKCKSVLSVECAAPMTFFIIISVFAFTVLICLLTR